MTDIDSSVWDMRLASMCRTTLEELTKIKAQSVYGSFPFESAEEAFSAVEEKRLEQEKTDRIEALTDDLFNRAIGRFLIRYMDSESHSDRREVKLHANRLILERRFEELETFLSNCALYDHRYASEQLTSPEKIGKISPIFTGILSLVEVLVVVGMLLACTTTFETMVIGAIAFIYSAVMSGVRSLQFSQTARHAANYTNLNMIRRLLNDRTIDPSASNDAQDMLANGAKKEQVYFYIYSAKFLLINIASIVSVLKAIL